MEVSVVALSLNRRISLLWAAALNLEVAAQRTVQHLPPDEAKKLQSDINQFRNAIHRIRGN